MALGEKDIMWFLFYEVSVRINLAETYIMYKLLYSIHSYIRHFWVQINTESVTTFWV